MPGPRVWGQADLQPLSSVRSAGRGGRGTNITFTSVSFPGEEKGGRLLSVGGVMCETHVIVSSWALSGRIRELCSWTRRVAGLLACSYSQSLFVERGGSPWEGPPTPSSLILCHHPGVHQLPDFTSDTVDLNEPATHRGMDSSCVMALHPQASLSSQVPICPALLFKLAVKSGYPACSVICQHGS